MTQICVWPMGSESNAKYCGKPATHSVKLDEHGRPEYYCDEHTKNFEAPIGQHPERFEIKPL
jgi:hypothetical protein